MVNPYVTPCCDSPGKYDYTLAKRMFLAVAMFGIMILVLFDIFLLRFGGFDLSMDWSDILMRFFFDWRSRFI